MDCATLHQKEKQCQESMGFIKDVRKEQWDDYQLKSVAVGGNK